MSPRQLVEAQIQWYWRYEDDVLIHTVDLPATLAWIEKCKKAASYFVVNIEEQANFFLNQRCRKYQCYH